MSGPSGHTQTSLAHHWGMMQNQGNRRASCVEHAPPGGMPIMVQDLYKQCNKNKVFTFHYCYKELYGGGRGGGGGGRRGSACVVVDLIAMLSWCSNKFRLYCF